MGLSNIFGIDMKFKEDVHGPFFLAEKGTNSASIIIR